MGYSQVITAKSGTQRWYMDDVLHREDGPAVVYVDGTMEWYQHGRLHRENGPAIEDLTGMQRWYYNGHLHRTDGPAVMPAILSHHSSDWYVRGIRCISADHFRMLTNCSEVELIQMILTYGEIG